MIFDNQLRIAADIIDSYTGDVPLHGWLKEFFRAHKQMGSRDRKTLSSLVYGYYRLGHAVRELPVRDRILLGWFLVQEQGGALLEHFRPDWAAHAGLGLEEKIGVVTGSGVDFVVGDIFPWKGELSASVDHTAFCLSFLRQPDLFLRIRPGYQRIVLDKVAGVAHELIAPSALRLPNGWKVEEAFTPDKEVVVQDLSSQRIAELIPQAATRFWDACAASGGKSILVHDLLPSAEITVSDIRDSILQNLAQRFQRAGIKAYTSFMTDLSREAPDRLRYDLILVDVPCTGSGTWSRTPEELYFFNPRKIESYRQRQRAIVENILSRVQKGTSFVYSTCSVFKQENEDMIQFVREGFKLKLEKERVIGGWTQRADSMYGARFRLD